MLLMIIYYKFIHIALQPQNIPHQIGGAITARARISVLA